MLHSAVLAMSPYLENAGYLALLALGFGFVVFWHELGHFLAAKWAGVRVEQFAVGFAHAVFSWRKGMGFRLGSSQREYKKRIYEKLGKVYPDKGEPTEVVSDLEMRKTGESLGLGETEYRLNWLPLGGYVKMLGQDDLRPNSEADDPKAYNRQSIGKRMVIVSAGVIMNVILAAIGFMILFKIGFRVPPTLVGSIQPNSPAQAAGIQIGDRILQLDGKNLHNDYTKLQLNAALSASGEAIPVRVERLMADGTTKLIDLTVQPAKADQGGIKLVGLGVGQYADLKGPPTDGSDPDATAVKKDDKSVLVNARIIAPGDVITHVNGIEVESDDFILLDAAVQTGRPVKLKIKGADGQSRDAIFHPMFSASYGSNQFELLGMVPRSQIIAVTPDSPLYGKTQAGDVLLQIRDENSVDASTRALTFESLSKFVNDAANAGKKVRLTVLRDGKPVEFEPIAPVKIRRGVYGVGVGLAVEDPAPQEGTASGGAESATTVAEIRQGSAAAAAGLQEGARITRVNGESVSNWRDVHRALRDAAPADAKSATVELAYETRGGEARTATLQLAEPQIAEIHNVRYASGLGLAITKQTRRADGLLQAMQWGVIETRDFILQFYVTLKRMVTGDVSATNLMGPVGIFQTGTTIASRGGDWLLWFLSMISANLAVVNFLPIPIVDGGLFTFLVLEKIKGKPASPRTQAIAQYVGLVLLLSIFVFVTWQDIANFQFR